VLKTGELRCYGKVWSCSTCGTCHVTFVTKWATSLWFLQTFLNKNLLTQKTSKQCSIVSISIYFSLVVCLSCSFTETTFESYNILKTSIDHLYILIRAPTTLKSEGEVTSLSGADKREVRDNRFVILSMCDLFETMLMSK
jgi:hypothetical protein